MVNGVPTPVVYQASEYLHRVKTLQMTPKSPLEMCLQVTVEPPFAEVPSQPQSHCFRPFDSYIEAARSAIARRVRRSIHGAASALQIAVLPVVWVARALMAR